MLVLQGIGRSEAAQDQPRGATSPRRARAWTTFKRDAVRADITDDVVELLRPAAWGGGAAGVAALMGIPLVGTAYILELGRRHDAPLTAAWIVPAVIGGIIGWGIDLVFNLSLIRLVVPKEPPDSFVLRS